MLFDGDILYNLQLLFFKKIYYYFVGIYIEQTINQKVLHFTQEN